MPWRSCCTAPLIECATKKPTQPTSCSPSGSSWYGAACPAINPSSRFPSRSHVNELQQPCSVLFPRSHVHRGSQHAPHGGSCSGWQVIFFGSFACGCVMGMVTSLLMKYTKIRVRGPGYALALTVPRSLGPQSFVRMISSVVSSLRVLRRTLRRNSMYWLLAALSPRPRGSCPWSLLPLCPALSTCVANDLCAIVLHAVATRTRVGRVPPCV